MTKQELVHRIEACVPVSILMVYRKAKRFVVWKDQQWRYKTAINTIRKKKKPIKVVFIVNDCAIWKYDSLYRLLAENPAFSPMILVCPTIIGMAKDQAQERLQLAYDTFSDRGYNVMKAAENVSLHGISVASLQPDIVFYSYCWTNIMETQYRERNLRKYLKCYVNYGFSNTDGEWGYASAFHGLMWRYFAECEDVRALALQAQPREMRNIVVTGYPVYDEFQVETSGVSLWKNTNPKYKHIIWAPHHTIEGHDGLLKFSTFLEIAEDMLLLAERYKDSLQFAFKPHPLLKAVLYHHPKWGVEKTDTYYQRWADGINTVLVSGPYIDLFKTSDAMIHDCGSFIVEGSKGR